MTFFSIPFRTRQERKKERPHEKALYWNRLVSSFTQTPASVTFHSVFQGTRSSSSTLTFLLYFLVLMVFLLVCFFFNFISFGLNSGSFSSNSDNYSSQRKEELKIETRCKPYFRSELSIIGRRMAAWITGKR